MTKTCGQPKPGGYNENPSVYKFSDSDFSVTY